MSKPADIDNRATEEQVRACRAALLARLVGDGDAITAMLDALCCIALTATDPAIRDCADAPWKLRNGYMSQEQFDEVLGTLWEREAPHVEAV